MAAWGAHPRGRRASAQQKPARRRAAARQQPARRRRAAAAARETRGAHVCDPQRCHAEEPQQRVRHDGPLGQRKRSAPRGGAASAPPAWARRGRSARRPLRRPAAPAAPRGHATARASGSSRPAPGTGTLWRRRTPRCRWAESRARGCGRATCAAPARRLRATGGRGRAHQRTPQRRDAARRGTPCAPRRCATPPGRRHAPVPSCSCWCAPPRVPGGLMNALTASMAAGGACRGARRANFK